tara:strand:+ start:163173 stop:163814 length:642 start_codon:yes stop_codon:yes gene_type:complete
MRTLLTIFFLTILLSFNSISQAEFAPKGSFKVEISLPNNATNTAFRDLMQGLVCVSPSYQHTLDNTLSFGFGLRYNYFDVNEFKNTVDLAGGMHTTGVFGKIGQEKFYGNFGVDYGVRVGYSFNFFATNKNEELLDGPYINDAGFVEPHLGLALTANENTSFRLALGYAFHAFEFRPNQVGLENFAGIGDDQLNSITTYFTIGFGYSYYFGQN